MNNFEEIFLLSPKSAAWGRTGAAAVSAVGIREWLCVVQRARGDAMKTFSPAAGWTIK